ncbi:MAG: hypothetical protein CSA81_08785 [Acidobacteria bacterium]|nr:MAG: hypothetical protein CSA81_08785 [Acidobacteriota bacterium]
MNTERLIQELKSCLEEIDKLKTIEEGIKNPKVKAWRSRSLEALKQGGKACNKAFASLQSMQFASKGYEDTFVGQQSYINQHDAMKKILSQTIMTLELFGRPEDKDELPEWRPPAKNRVVKGRLVIDGMEVEPNSVTIEEMLKCFEQFVKESPALTEQMRFNIQSKLLTLLQNDLYKPFLSQKLDKLFAHWPDNS